LVCCTYRTKKMHGIKFKIDKKDSYWIFSYTVALILWVIVTYPNTAGPCHLAVSLVVILFEKFYVISFLTPSHKVPIVVKVICHALGL
jgi:hypothetical protein